jgi:hypothetical protein
MSALQSLSDVNFIFKMKTLIQNPKLRIRASAIHLAISVTVAVIAALQIFLVWYPNPIQQAMGANGLFWLILTVDVILGPLLTFVVFNPAKKSLRMDLAVIGFVQLIALGYGMNTMYQGKAAYLSFAKDRFEVARVADIDSALYDRPTTSKDFSPSDRFFSPKFVVIKWPTEIKARNDFLSTDIASRVDHYISAELGAAQIKQAAKPFVQLEKLNPGREQELAKVAAQWKSQGVSEIAFVPFRADHEHMAVLVDGQTGKILEIVPFNPWES